MKSGKWIWRNMEDNADEYVVFFDDFYYTCGSVKIDISVYGDYAIYVNECLSGFGQYADFSSYKVYDTIDLSSYVKNGENKVKILVWHIGAGSLTQQNNGCGLRYSIYIDDEILTQSNDGCLCALSNEYISHQKQIITAQLGFSYTYDTRNLPLNIEKTVQVEGPSVLYERPNKKVVLSDNVEGKLIDKKLRIYDLGKEYCGFLNIRFCANNGQEVKVAYGEHLKDGKVRRLIGDRDFSVNFIGNGKIADVTGVFRRLGCRYLQVLCDENVEVQYIGIVETQYPFNEITADIDDPLRRQIYDVSVRTLRLCAHEHYEDCPWREQAMYIEDSRNQMLCGYYAFDNLEFAASAIVSMLQGQRQDGLFEICFPSEWKFTIPSFSLVFPLVVLEYTQAAKDTSIAKKALPAIEKMLNFFNERVSKNGLFKTVSEKSLWHFYEWSGNLDGNYFSKNEFDKKRDGYDVVINAFLSMAYKKTAEICNVLGEFFKEEYYLEKQTKCNKSINDMFFNIEKGMYRTYEDEETYSQLANSLCILCGACSEDLKISLAEKLAGGYNGWTKNTLSMNVFRFDALLDADKKRFAPIVLSEIDKIYSAMLEQGATSFWETEKGCDDFDGAGSLCHGWSAIPIYYYHILGITKNSNKPLSEAFALRDNAMRISYKQSLEKYLDKRTKDLDKKRIEYIKRPEFEKRETFYRILGEPLVGEFPKSISLIKKELVIKTFEWVVERYVFDILDGIEFCGFVYRLRDDDTHKNKLVYCLHGGGGTPERVGGLFHDSSNYNNVVKRVLKKGTVVFAPQLWLWNAEIYGDGGDRGYFNRRLIQQGGSITALELFCLMRTLDYFTAQDYVDETRVGVVGLSYGGMYSLHFAALDTRIKSALSSCWFSDRRIHNWHDWTYFNGEKYMLDADVASIVLPRKLYIEIGKNDPTFKLADAQNEKQRLIEFAKSNNYEDSLVFSEFDGAHELDANDKTLQSFLESF